MNLSRIVCAASDRCHQHSGVKFCSVPGGCLRPRILNKHRFGYGSAFWSSHNKTDVKCEFQQSETSAVANTLDTSNGVTGRTDFCWESNWYPVAILKDVEGSKPIPVTLLGKSLVLWEASPGKWHCVTDRCAHRYVPLSEGRIKDGDIQCAYHGWQYNGSGQCTRIPQAEDACACTAACVEAFPTQLRAGAIWIWPDSSPNGVRESSSTQPSIDTVLEESLEYIDWYIRDFPYGYTGLIEMLLDPSHCPFTLHGIGLFNRDQGKPMPSTLVECSTEGPSARISVECARAFRPAGHPSDATVTFNSPCHVTHDFVGVNGHVIHGMYILPVAPGRSRLLYWHKAGSPGGAALDRLKALRAPLGLGRAALQRLVAATEKFFVAYERCKRHMYLHPIFEAVGGLLHGQEYRVSSAGSPAGFHMPTSADQMVTNFYGWLLGSAGGGPSWPPGTPPLPPLQLDREALLGRRLQHLASCPSCQTVLAVCERMQLAANIGVALGLAALAISIGARSPWYLPATVAVVICLSWRQVRGLAQWHKQFGFVDYVHAERN